MPNPASGKSFIPQIDGRALDAIKGLAAVLMVIDHMNFFWFKDQVYEMMLLGRAVFPLFCYAVVMAMLRAPRKTQHYLYSLLMLGLLSEPFVQLTRPDSPLNVIFTLALGVFVADIARKAKDWQLTLGFAACAIATVVLKIPLEFGLSGVALPAAMMLVIQGRLRFVPLLLLLLFTMNVGGVSASMKDTPELNLLAPDVLFTMFSVGLGASLLPYMLLMAVRDLPQTGRWLSKYSLHFFYPLHQLLLWALALHFFPK